MSFPATILAGIPGGYEWIIILVIFLLLFGRRLPGVARSLGQGISSFKKGLNDPVSEKDDKSDDEPTKAEKTEKESADV